MLNSLCFSFKFQAFTEVAHSIKGAALSLALPALSDVFKTAEYLGKDLQAAPTVRLSTLSVNFRTLSLDFLLSLLFVCFLAGCH